MPAHAPVARPAPPAAPQPTSPLNPRAPVPVGGPAKPAAVCGRCRGVNPSGMQFCQVGGAPLGGVQEPAPPPVFAAPPPLPQPVQVPQPPPQGVGGQWAPAAAGARAGARLVVITQDGSPGRTYEITEAQVDVGREEGSILLPNDPYVTGRHARLRRQNNQFLVRDLGSVNGVYVKLRRPERLEHGDLVLVGLEVLRFELVTEAEKALGPALERGTLVFGSPATTRYARLCQRTVEGVTRDIYSLYRDETIIGRESGDIVFTSDPFMSRQHAAINRNPQDGSFTLRDVGSSNGTYLAIRGEVALQSGDHLRIGQHLFRLEVDPE
jgi:pSer/pThr/pTyr-binding forkhead associated (FHA) protein